MAHKKLGILAACLVIFIGALLTPAGAHVGGTVAHLWQQHLLPLAKKAFYTKGQSDQRYLRKTTTVQHLIVTAPEWETDLGNDFQEIENPAPAGGNNLCMQVAAVSTAWAPVHLPQGARVSKIEVDYVDDGSEIEHNATVSLTPEPLRGSGLSTAPLLTVSIPNAGTPGLYDTKSASLTTPAKIDNAKAGYILDLLTDAAPHICAVDISYRYP